MEMGGGSASGTMTTALDGTDPANFMKASDTCNGAALAAGSSCSVDLYCTRACCRGSRNATLTVTAIRGGYPLSDADLQLDGPRASLRAVPVL